MILVHLIIDKEVLKFNPLCSLLLVIASQCVKGQPEN